MKRIVVGIVLCLVIGSSPAAASTPVGVQLLDEAAVAREPAVRVAPPPAPPILSNEEIIRIVWPDNLEDRAVRIAYRESRFNCCVRTSCCFGLFQIHRIHLAWLGPLLGIYTTAQLYDPWLNAQAALALYERDRWGPWVCC